MKSAQPWLKSPAFDLSFIIGPSLAAVLIVVILQFFRTGETDPISMSPVLWIVFVLGIDVSHVYSSLFRTYFNSTEFRENKKLLTLIPVFVWLIGIACYSVDRMVFWRALTYVAVFHFMRQQYGFLRIYSRNEKESRLSRRLSTATIYLATLYPILFWHSHQPRNFHWFIDGDFVDGISPIFSNVGGAAYLCTLIAYFVNEFLTWRRSGFLNVPKNGIVIGTALSWYIGIVLFDGDLAFTVTNVVSHGIPYVALIWLYGSKQMIRPDSPKILGRFSYRYFFTYPALPIFFGSIFLFGFVEEGLWAGLVWRENLSFFGPMANLPRVTSKETLTWLVPLLTLPQATHYVLDGFIWKIHDSGANWQKILFSRKHSASSI